MRTISYSKASRSLKAALDAVHDDADITLLLRGGADSAVMTLDHYQRIIETMHLLATPANAAHLAKSIRTAQSR